MHDPNDHDHDRWEDDGGRPCLPKCECQVMRDCGPRRCLAEPMVPRFASPPQKPSHELPAGDEYRRMISGG